MYPLMCVGEINNKLFYASRKLHLNIQNDLCTSLLFPLLQNHFILASKQRMALIK